MSDVTVRKIKKMSHVEGCRKLRTCTCPFEFEGGWLYDIRFKWPSGRAFREKKQVPLSGLTEKKALAWAVERRNAIITMGELALIKQKEEQVVPVPTLREFGPTYIKDFCKANRNKPRTVDGKAATLAFH